ncbi:unnamed protein product [Penicillium olsonii]|nr:unnamed protein product [Penicillium olsonii]
MNGLSLTRMIIGEARAWPAGGQSPVRRGLRPAAPPPAAAPATRAASSRTPPAPNPRASRPANRLRAEPSGSAAASTAAATSSAAAAASATLLARKFHPHYFTPVPWTSSQANDVGLPGAESSWSSSSCSIGSKTAGRLSEACGLLTSESIA